MNIDFYEIFEDDGEGYMISYGCFSTYEKAVEFRKQFNDIDGFGICVEYLKIEKRTLRLDVVDEWVVELINDGKKRKERT